MILFEINRININEYKLYHGSASWSWKYIKIWCIMNLMLNKIQWCLNVSEQNIYTGIHIKVKCKGVIQVKYPMGMQLAVDINKKK